MMGTLADLYSINAAYLVPMVSFASVTVFAYSELDGGTPAETNVTITRDRTHQG
jgi:hypothetical protein